MASALRTTAGRGQQGPHISEASSKLASLNPPKYSKTNRNEGVQGDQCFFYFVYHGTNGLDETFEIKAEP